MSDPGVLERDETVITFVSNLPLNYIRSFLGGSWPKTDVLTFKSSQNPKPTKLSVN
jgi:hypothetical protein